MTRRRRVPFAFPRGEPIVSALTISDRVGGPRRPIVGRHKLLMLPRRDRERPPEMASRSAKKSADRESSSRFGNNRWESRVDESRVVRFQFVSSGRICNLLYISFKLDFDTLRNYVKFVEQRLIVFLNERESEAGWEIRGHASPKGRRVSCAARCEREPSVS